MSLNMVLDALPYVMKAYQRVQHQSAAGTIVVTDSVQRVPIGDLTDENIVAAVRETVNRVPVDDLKRLLYLAAGCVEIGTFCANVTGVLAAKIIVTRYIPDELIVRSLMERTVSEYTAKYASGTKWAAAMPGSTLGGLTGYKLLTYCGPQAATDRVIRNQSPAQDVLHAAGSISTAAASSASTGPPVMELRPYVGMAVGATVTAIVSYCTAGECLRKAIQILVERLVEGLEREIEREPANQITAREMERLMLQPQLQITEITDMELEMNQG